MEKGTPEYLEFRKRANENNRRYYAKPEVKVKRKIYKKKHDIKNKESIREYGIKLRARPEYKERINRWREEKSDYLKAKAKEWRTINKDYKREIDKKYRIKNRERVNQQHREWRNTNLEVVRKYNKKYYTSPKGIINYTHHNHRRLALIKERPCDLNNEKIIEIFNRDKVCVYCGSNIKLELDHIIPLKLGGNSLFNNFVLACKRCNTSKSGRDVFEWCKLIGIEVPKIVLELLARQQL
jgi:5-methylcytosine-specific restriction endonuclease McrA